MITSILLGILSSIASETVTFINKKLKGTVLAGTAAFLIAFGMSIVIAVAKQLYTSGFEISSLTHWSSISATFGQVFTWSQVYFTLIVKKLTLDVQPKEGPVAEKMKLNI
jgi:hypothetical protein